MHGHFYQPPREDPWTGVVPEQPDAAPFHDWNERITAECYAPNAAVELIGDGGEPFVVSNYEHLSFNVGPTLLSWLEAHHPDVYGRIVAADAAAGRAIAQAYGHAILPLCNAHDLRTQVRWGILDFVHRFGRHPDAMWLPETAVSDAVLLVLAEEGIGITILAPGQIEAVRPVGADDSAWSRPRRGRRRRPGARRHEPALPVAAPGAARAHRRPRGVRRRAGPRAGLRPAHQR